MSSSSSSSVSPSPLKFSVDIKVDRYYFHFPFGNLNFVTFHIIPSLQGGLSINCKIDFLTNVFVGNHLEAALMFLAIKNCTLGARVDFDSLSESYGNNLFYSYETLIQTNRFLKIVDKEIIID
ncbi:hypothetical protein ACTA71_011268 [Dictyostelium dimigraforme]